MESIMNEYIERFNKIIVAKLSEGIISDEDFDIIESALLSDYTSFKTGGNAFIFIPKTIKAIKTIFPEIKKNGIKYFILGYGSNTLALDEGYQGIIILLTALNEVSIQNEYVLAQSGCGFTKLSNICKDNSLSGLEFAYGIPGTVGGAVFMNAGAYGGETIDVIESADAIFEDGEIKTLYKEELGLGYRTSVFQNNNAIIISAKFKLKRKNKDEIFSEMKDYMARRKEKQPLEYPSAGSTFKRLPGKFTAKLIDENGLKGKRIGGAMVSEKHAGFIINYDNASSNDILSLIALIKDKIYQSTGEHIQTEIRIIE